MLYLSVMTVFLCVVIWETERVGRKKGECCGLFMCKQNSIFCCKGWFLSKKMVAYGSLKEAAPAEYDKSKEAVVVHSYEPSSKTEAFIDKYIAPNLISVPGRITMIVIYILLISFSIYGVTQVKIDFKVTFFIGETSSVYEYFQLNDKYFSTGSTTNTYVDNSALDYSSTEVQKKLLIFNDAIQECTGCDEKWSMPDTLEQWYADFNEFTKAGKCPSVPLSVDENFTVPQDKFYSCLALYLSAEGRKHVKDLVYTG